MTQRISVWDDPEVKAALAEGRPANDICVLNCHRCGRLSYYNEGSWFYCRHCDDEWFVLGENEVPEDTGREAMECYRPDCCLTLSDVIDAECLDYP